MLHKSMSHAGIVSYLEGRALHSPSLPPSTNLKHPLLVSSSSVTQPALPQNSTQEESFSFCVYALQQLHWRAQTLWPSLVFNLLILWILLLLLPARFPSFHLVIDAVSSNGPFPLSSGRHKRRRLKFIQWSARQRPAHTFHQITGTLCRHPIHCATFLPASTTLMWLHKCPVEKGRHKPGLSCDGANWMTLNNHPNSRDLSPSMIKPGLQRWTSAWSGNLQQRF